MKKALLSLAAASALAALAGCETTQGGNTVSAKDPDAEVITGSRIPRKAGTGAESVTGAGTDYKGGQPGTK